MSRLTVVKEIKVTSVITLQIAMPVSKVCTINWHRPALKVSSDLIPCDLIIALLANLVQGNNPRKRKGALARGVGQINSDGPISGNFRIDGHRVLQDGNICHTMLKGVKTVTTTI